MKKLILFLAAVATVNAASVTMHYTLTNRSGSAKDVYFKSGISPSGTPASPFVTVAAGATVEGDMTGWETYDGYLLIEAWFDVTEGGTVVGNSYVGAGGSSTVHSPGAPDSWSYSEEGGDGIIAVNWSFDAKSSTPDSAKTLWRVEDGTLTADVFREGIDKVVYANKSSSSGGGGFVMLDGEMVSLVGTAPSEETTGAIESKAADMMSGLVPHATVINTAIGDSVGTIAAASLTAGTPPAGGFLPDIVIDTTSGTHTFSTNFFASFSDVIDLATWAGWMREIILASMAYTFVVFMRAKFELYYLTWWKLDTKTTKQDATTNLPQVGWGKQALTASLMAGVLVSVVTVTILSLNTSLGSLMTGWSFASAFSETSETINAVTGSSAISQVYGFLAMFFPFAAGFQFIFSRYLLEWSFPAVWSLAMMAQKYFHI